MAHGYIPIETLDFFKDLEILSDEVWDYVAKWPAFEKSAIGLQLVRAMDSIGANLAEGDGRRSDRDSLNFFNVARASARETRYWLNRASARNLIEEEAASDCLCRLESIMKRMSALMAVHRTNMNSVKEDSESYTV